ncbi:hypothetical protein HHX47_DHR2000632 [Lentinula edodes]|nr:hypothetical protein HHX47_DHR2000632 [Lentinula edodes]
MVFLPLFAFVAVLPCALSLVTSRPRQGVDFFNPTGNGGSMLDDAGNGLGEPLNVIISGLSSPGVLTESGFENYAKAIGFSTECLGIHIGGPQSANLGDGNGFVNQTVELRQDYGDSVLEEDASDNHDIVPDGYDIGRDELSAAAIGTTSFDGVTYSTTGTNLTGLLAPGSAGVNHDIATDGITTLLTVIIV